MKYTKEQLNIAKNILLSLISEDRKIDDANYGICFNASRHPINKYDEWSGDCLVSMYDVVDKLSVGWEHHSGLVPYPIPYIEGNKWEGKNLELRIDLMKYIVSKIDELLERGRYEKY